MATIPPLSTSTGKTMSTRLTIYPNNGIGIFSIGQQLSQCVKKMQSFGNDIEFHYSKLNLIVVCNKTMGVSLFFDSHLQRLLLIKINVLADKIKYVYQNTTIDQFTFKNVYNRYFGPTFEGEYNQIEQTYYLSYSGISFVFTDINDTINSNKKLNTSDSDKSCSNFFIYRHDKKENWFEFSEKMSKTLNNSFGFEYLQTLKEVFLTEDERLSIGKVTLSLYDQHILYFDMIRQKKPETFIINVGSTSMQSIIRYFGFPDNTIFKRKKRTNLVKHKKISNLNVSINFETTRNFLPMSIIDRSYNTENLVSPKGVPCDLINCEQESIIIHNYFDFGFDVVYDLNATANGSGIVSRVILHQNPLESTEFLRYNKIPILYRSSSNASLLQLKTLSEVRDVVTLTNLPVFFDRKKYNIEESVDAGEDFEIVDSITSDKDEKFKYWGLSNYDGCQFAIWESLISNDEISCITILESKSS